MSILKCNIGIWNVEARVEEVDDSKRMAIISAVTERDGRAVESRHTVVFEHVEGCDQEEEAKAVMQRVLK